MSVVAPLSIRGSINGYKNIVIYCDKKLTSKIIGNKRKNIIKLKEKFNLNSIQVVNKDTDGFYIEGK